jgi:hypothetical protein
MDPWDGHWDFPGGRTGQRNRGLWWQQVTIPSGPERFQGKAIESSEYLDGHLAWMGNTIELRSEPCEGEWS